MAAFSNIYTRVIFSSGLICMCYISTSLPFNITFTNLLFSHETQVKNHNVKRNKINLYLPKQHNIFSNLTNINDHIMEQNPYFNRRNNSNQYLLPALYYYYIQQNISNNLSNLILSMQPHHALAPQSTPILHCLNLTTTHKKSYIRNIFYSKIILRQPNNILLSPTLPYYHPNLRTITKKTHTKDTQLIALLLSLQPPQNNNPNPEDLSNMNTDNTDTFGKPPHHNDNDPKQDTTPILSGDDKRKYLCDDSDIMNVKYLLPLYVCGSVITPMNNSTKTSDRALLKKSDVVNNGSKKLKPDLALSSTTSDPNIDQELNTIKTDNLIPTVKNIKKSAIYANEFFGDTNLGEMCLPIDFSQLFQSIQKNLKYLPQNSEFIQMSPNDRINGFKIKLNNSDIIWSFYTSSYTWVELSHNGADKYLLNIDNDTSLSSTYQPVPQSTDTNSMFMKLDTILDQFIAFLNSFPESEKAKFILPTAQESGASSSTDQPPLIRTENDAVTKVPHPVAEMPSSTPYDLQYLK